MALIPIFIARKGLFDLVKSSLSSFNTLKPGIGLAIGSVITTLLSKFLGNFVLAAIFVPIFGLISTLFIIIGTALGDATDVFNSEKASGVDKMIRSMLPKPMDVIRRYIRAIRLIGVRLTERFPLLGSIFNFMNRLFNKLKSTFENVKRASINKINELKKKEDGELQEAFDIKKILGWGFIGSVVVFLHTEYIEN